MVVTMMDGKDFSEWIDYLAETLRTAAESHEDMSSFEDDGRLYFLERQHVENTRSRFGWTEGKARARFAFGAHIAYQEAHPDQEVWKCFYLNGRRLCAYTLIGEGAGEEESTLGLLAYENQCAQEDIGVLYEVREVER